jgi:hypothetical protein
MEITICKINQFKNKEFLWVEVLFKEVEKKPFQNGSLNIAIPHDENLSIKEIESAAKIEALKMIESFKTHLDQP